MESGRFVSISGGQISERKGEGGAVGETLIQIIKYQIDPPN